MKSVRLRPFACALALLAFSVPLSLRAQFTTNLTEATRTLNPDNITYSYNTWKPLLGMPGAGQTGAGGYLYDPVNDSQTGLPAADFVSSAGNPGFFIKTFEVSGTPYLAFRSVMDVLPSNSNLYMRLGLDVDLNGSVDMFFGPTFSGANLVNIAFVAPGTGLNVSPSTSSIDGTPIRTITPANAYYASTTTATAGIYPGWTTQNADADGVMSFAVPISEINAALAHASIGKGAFTVTSTSSLRWVAFTANQQNTVNQDTYGLRKTGNNGLDDDVRFDSFAQIMNPQGMPIPEPSSYGLFLGVGLGAFYFLRRRRTIR